MLTYRQVWKLRHPVFLNSAGRDKLLNGLYSMTPSYAAILLKDLGPRQPRDG